MNSVYVTFYMELERRKRRDRKIVSCIFWMFVLFLVSIIPPKPQTTNTTWQRIDRHGDVISDAELKSQVINRAVEMGAR